MAYGKSKNLAKRTHSDKVLWDKAFKIASDPKYDGYQRGLASMIYKFSDKKSSGSGVAATVPDYQFANEFHRQIIRKFKKIEVYSSFRDYLGCRFSWYAIIGQIQQRNQVFIVCNWFV